MGHPMFSRDFNLDEAGYAGGNSRRDAVDGLAAIEFALDQGLEPTGHRSGRMTDGLAIGLGWLVLVAVIFYPALQLGAIALGGGLLCLRSFARFLFASPVPVPARSWGDRGSLAAV